MAFRKTGPRDRRLLIGALSGLAIWLAAVVALTLWKYPWFWLTAEQHYARAQELYGEGAAEEGRGELEAAIRKAPRVAGYHVFRGYRQLDGRDAAGAEESFLHALSIEPSDAEARLGLASALISTNRRQDALQVLDVLPADALSDGQLRRRSQLYGVLEAPGRALADLTRLLESGAVPGDLLEEAVEHALTLQDWHRVITYAEWLQARELAEDTRRWIAGVRASAELASGLRAPAYENLKIAAAPDNLERRAGLAWDLQRFDEAAVLFEELADRERGEPRFRRMQAFALLAAGRREPAQHVFRALVAESAADVPVRRTYAWMLNVQRRYAEAWQVLEPLPRPAGDLALLELQARTAVWAGRSADASQLLAALLRDRPENAELWMDLANVRYAEGDSAGAAEALSAYVRLKAEDAETRERLARMLAASGSSDRALAHYRRLLADDPLHVRAAVAIGLLEETRGQLEAAKSAYRAALAMGEPPHAELYLRLARLHRWTGQPQPAREYYERYLDVETERSRRSRAYSELALALLDAGEPLGTLTLLQKAEEVDPLDADALLTAARAAASVGRPDVAARYLEHLATRRALTPQEEKWLAGAHRAAGRRETALAIFDKIAASEAEPDAAVLEAIADLRYDTGDYAGALEALQRIGNPERLQLKLARMAARAGELSLASRTYHIYAAAHPQDIAGQLEAARFFAGAGQPSTAIAHYRTVVERRGAGGLRVELARIHLAAEQFDTAEGWARQAVAAGETVEDARLALAQALHVMGRHAEADATLRAIIVGTPDRAEAHAWRAQVAVARDRHYAAYRAFTQALAHGADRGERLALWMSTAARKRGDYARANEALERASALSAEPALVAAARRELDRVTLPNASVPAWTHGDSNDLRLAQAGGGLTFVLPRLAGSLSLDVASGSLSQLSFSSTHTGARLSLAQVFPSPALELGGRVALHRFDRGRDLLSWQGTATWHLTDAAEAGISVGRHSLLPLFGPTPLRQFNRVLDVGRIGPDFFTDAMHAFGEFLTETSHRARIELGAERLKDGNRQARGYVHYQLPITLGVRRWTVIRPNVFFETFRSNNPAYFSPQRHLTVGTMLHTIRQYPHWNLELEVNPQLLRTDGATGLGGHGLVNVRIQRGRTSVDLGTFLFYDGLEDYLQWRVGARVTVPLGR